MRLLEDDLIHNLKRLSHRHKGDLVIQYRCNNCRIRTITTYESQGIPVGLDGLQLALPHRLCSDCHHWGVFESEAVSHYHFAQLTLKWLVQHDHEIRQLGKLLSRIFLACARVRLLGTSTTSDVAPVRAANSTFRFTIRMKFSSAS